MSHLTLSVTTRRCFRYMTVGVLVALASLLVAEEDAELEWGVAERAREYRAQTMEEVVVQGERIDPATMDFLEMEQIYAQKATASRNFKIGKYEEAFPQLLQLAKLGFKDAQARVAYIYLFGKGGQQKSNLKALGWLGVASYGRTRPQYRNIFKQMLNEVPPEQADLARFVVEDYRAKFNADKLGIECWHSNINHIRQFTCRFSDEMFKYYNHMTMTGTPFSGTP